MKNTPNLNACVRPRPHSRLLFWLRLLTWGLVAGTLAGRLGSYFFLFELFSHFAVQYAVLAGLLVGFWLYRSRSLALVSALLLLVNGLIIRPWLTTAPHPGGRRDVRVLQANVLFAGTDYSDIIRLVQTQSPDLFVLQEMTPASIRGVAGLKPTFPYQYHIWSKGPCYILVGSRTPIRVDSALARPERVISLTTSVRGHDMVLLTVHPKTPLLPTWFADRNRQLAFVAQRVRQQRLPTVLVGDFNISMFSSVYFRIFQSPFASLGITACRRGFGLQPTWPRFLPLLYIPIDHAFINSGFRTVDFQTVNQPGSDHRALVVDLAFTGAPMGN